MAKEKNTPAISDSSKGELGALLQEYREKIAFSIPQMADALCLSEKTITDLEEENFQELAEPPYIRGYLRNYAKIAEEDSTELVNRYELLRGANPNEVKKQHFKTSPIINTSSRRSLSPIIIQVLFLLLLLGILAGITMIPSVNKWIMSTWDSFSNQTVTPTVESTDNPLLTGTMPVPTELPSEEIEVQESEQENTTAQPAISPEASLENRETSNTTNSPESNLTNSQIETTETTAPENTETNATAETTTAIAQVGNKVNLKFVFNQDVWMRIRNKDNKTVFEGLTSSGNEKVLNLEKPLKFRIGNAQGLSVFVNGASFNIDSYIKGSVATFTLE